MKTWKAATALASVLILAGINAGCAAKPIVRGTVIELEYEPSKTACVAGSKKPGSTKPALPVCTRSAECWEIEVLDLEGSEHEFCLTERAWGRYRVGDQYPK